MKKGFWKKLLIGVACVAVIGSSAFTIADGIEKHRDPETNIEAPVDGDVTEDAGTTE